MAAILLIIAYMDAPTLIITVKEARKILGVEAKLYSDTEIEELIINYQSVAKLYFESVLNC